MLPEEYQKIKNELLQTLDSLESLDLKIFKIWIFSLIEIIFSQKTDLVALQKSVETLFANKDRILKMIEERCNIPQIK